MVFSEKGNNISIRLSELTLLEELSSPKNEHIQLYKHPQLGRVFILNGEVQHVDAWTQLYHEPLVHLPAAFIQNVQRVLILGGGCLLAAREVLKYNSVTNIVMIEHDATVIEMIERNYEHAKITLRDERFTLIVGDAFDELTNLEANFDLIINDSVDLISYFNDSEGKIFKRLTQLLSSSGVCVDMIYRHIFEKETVQTTLEVFKNNNLQPILSLITVLEYPGSLHLLILWGNNKFLSQNLFAPVNKIQQQWIEDNSSNPCDYFDPRFLGYFLYLPSYLKKTLNGSRNFQ